MKPVSESARAVGAHLDEIHRRLHAGEPHAAVFEHFTNPALGEHAWSAVAFGIANQRSGTVRPGVAPTILSSVPRDVLLSKLTPLLRERASDHTTLRLTRALTNALQFDNGHGAPTEASVRHAQDALETLFDRQPGVAHHAAKAILLSQPLVSSPPKQLQRAEKTLFDSLLTIKEPVVAARVKVGPVDEEEDLTLKEYFVDDAIPLLARTPTGRDLILKHLMDHSTSKTKKPLDWAKTRVLSRTRDALRAHRDEYATRPEVLAEIDRFAKK